MSHSSQPPDHPDPASGTAIGEDQWARDSEAVRMVEALLFAAAEPLSEADLAARLGADVDVARCLERLADDYRNRGVTLVRVAGGWQFRTAGDLAHLMRREVQETRKLSRAGVETLAIIAYHQPVTRAEIEEIRGVGISKGTVDVLLEAGWIKPRGRRKSPGRPLTFGTTETFLTHFGLNELADLPGLADLKAAGLLDSVDEALDRLDAEDRDGQTTGTGQLDLEEVLNAAGAAGSNEDGDDGT